MRLAEVDQVQNTVIDIATFENCKNINRFNETTLTLAIKMGWNIVTAFVRLILITIFLKQLRRDLSLILKNRNHDVLQHSNHSWKTILQSNEEAYHM